MGLDIWLDLGLFFGLFALFVYVFATVAITNLHKVYFMFHTLMMLWPLCMFAAQTTENPEFQLFYVKIAFVAVSLLGAGWLIFIIFLIGQSMFIQRNKLIALITPALIAAISVIINPAGAFVKPLNGGYIHRDYGPVFWFVLIVSLGYFFISLILMYRTLGSQKAAMIKSQIKLALFGFFVLTAFALSDVFINVVLADKLPVVPGLTSIGILLSDVCFVIAIMRYKVFDIVKIAHQDVIDTIAYGILVLDENEIVVEVNEAMRKYASLHVGEHFAIETILTNHALDLEMEMFLHSYRGNPPKRSQIEITFDNNRDIRHVNINAAPIVAGNMMIGRIITFQDVTELRRLIDETNQQNIVLYERNQSLITIQDELYEANQKLELMAITDSLTGCYNRRFLTQQLEHEMMMNIRHRIPFAIFLFDFDHFKPINDRYGHLAGDEVILSTVDIVKRTLRRTDILMRYGGEEFLIYLPHTSQEQANLLSERVRAAVESNRIEVEKGAHTLSITISIGVLSIEGANTETPENPKAYLNELFAAVDGALYQAKKEGRNRIVSLVR